MTQWEHCLAASRERDQRVYAASDGADVLGVVVSGPDLVEDAGHLGRLYVGPQHWGRGIGGRLYQAAIDHLTEAGFSQATLWVLERNTRARGWYERLGWEPTGARKTVYAPASIDDIRYRLDLNRALMAASRVRR